MTWGVGVGLLSDLGNIFGVRHLGQRTKPLRGGGERDRDKRSASATGPTGSDFARRLSRRATPCYPPAWRRSVLTSVSAFAPRRAGTPPGLRLLPIYSIYIKAKAVPVAASSSAVVSARPMRPDVRPRSVTALRIQDSSEDAFPALSDACSCGSWSRQGAEAAQDRERFASWCPRCVLTTASFYAED
jgi:hypothetical protein